MKSLQVEKRLIVRNIFIPRSRHYNRRAFTYKHKSTRQSRRRRTEVTVINDCVDTNDDYCKHESRWKVIFSFFPSLRFRCLAWCRFLLLDCFSRANIKTNSITQGETWYNNVTVVKDVEILNINEFAEDLWALFHGDFLAVHWQNNNKVNNVRRHCLLRKR